jgi:serine/threonine protein kinase/N-acetylneuraminic acid mutarotase
MLMEMPTSFGPHDAYRVVEEIGKGGFATVYKAHHAALDRYVAIKVLRPELLRDEHGRQRFEREARIAARLSGHPNIVTIYDYGEQDGLAYLILEYIDGTTLQKRLAEPISFAEIDRIVSGVSAALDFAHGHHLVHRDVKEANVLFGKDGRVVLSDFGIAKLLDSVTSVTASVIGTPEYMSPEQVMSANVDGRSDIYALGAMVYRIFAGRPPFAGSPLSILHQHVHETPPPLPTDGRPIPPGVEQVVQRALAKDPDARYATAGELAADLSAALRPAILRERAGGAAVADELGRTEQLADRPPTASSASSQVSRPGVARPDEPGPREDPAARPAASVDTPSRARAGPGRTPTPSGQHRPLTPRIPPPVITPAHIQAARRQQRSGRRRVWLPLAALLVLLLAGAALLRSGLFGSDLSAPLGPGAAATAVPATAAPPQPPPQVPAPTSATVATPPAAPPTAAPAAATSAPIAAHAAEHADLPTPAAASAARPAPTSAPTPASAPLLAPPLTTPRNVDTMTVLNDGKILVVGGRDGTNALATAELYDRSTNAWTPAGQMAAPRYRHTATLLQDGKVLIVGGQDTDASFLNTSELYDPATNSFSAVGSLEAARASHTATLLANGKVLVTGGYNASKFYNTAELYDPAEKSWSAAAPMAGIHSGHTATRLPDGTVLVVGGFGTTTQATAERYDPVTNSWASAGSMAEGRVNHTATLLPDGRVLIVGGVNSTAGGTYLPSAELYDPASGSWTGAAEMATRRAGHVATLLDGDRVLVAGGRDSTSSLAGAELYDASDNAWSPAGTLAAARWLPSAAPLPGGRVVIAGGRVGNSSLATAEEYDPATNAWQSQRQTLAMQLASQNNSGITGTATFTDLGEGKLRVEIHANGSGPGPQPAHIHEGSCNQINPAPKYTLSSVVNGVSITEIDASIQEVTSAPHAIHMHKSPEEMPVYVACADTRVAG